MDLTNSFKFPIRPQSSPAQKRVCHVSSRVTEVIVMYEADEQFRRMDSRFYRIVSFTQVLLLSA